MTDYTAPYAFTGTVKKVLVDVSGAAIEDNRRAVDSVEGGTDTDGTRARLVSRVHSDARSILGTLSRPFLMEHWMGQSDISSDY